MLVLISTATRLAADRREERFAALRLVGGTPADVRVIASAESVVSAFCGAVLGIVVFLLVRPALAGAALIGPQHLSSTVTPTWWGYPGMLVGVPVVSAIAALLAHRSTTPWIWPTRPPHDLGGTICACLVIAAGLALITVRGPRESGRESGPQVEPGAA